jgi:hypothetical protein
MLALIWRRDFEFFEADHGFLGEVSPQIGDALVAPVLGYNHS